MKTYKGFDKNLKCRDFQYKIGKEYKEKKAKKCECGFHACENPLEVFSYYPPANSRYCEVEQLGEIDRSNNSDSKVASTCIKIGAEIGISGIVEAGIQFILNKINWKNDKVTNTGDYSAATNTGNRSAATVTQAESVAISIGIEGKAKGPIGSWLVLAEWEESQSLVWHRKTVKAIEVDGKKIKADTFYILKNGKFKKVKDE